MVNSAAPVENSRLSSSKEKKYDFLFHFYIVIVHNIIIPPYSQKPFSIKPNNIQVKSSKQPSPNSRWCSSEPLQSDTSFQLLSLHTTLSIVTLDSLSLYSSSPFPKDPLSTPMSNHVLPSLPPPQISSLFSSLL